MFSTSARPGPDSERTSIPSDVGTCVLCITGLFEVTSTWRLPDDASPPADRPPVTTRLPRSSAARLVRNILCRSLINRIRRGIKDVPDYAPRRQNVSSITASICWQVSHVEDKTSKGRLPQGAGLCFLSSDEHCLWQQLLFSAHYKQPFHSAGNNYITAREIGVITPGSSHAC